MGCKPSDGLFSISPRSCNINQPFIPLISTCSIVFIFLVLLIQGYSLPLFIVSCAKRFASIFYCYSCIRSRCPFHFALQLPFSLLLFGVSIRFTSFGKSVGKVVLLFVVCSIALVPKAVLVSVLYFLVVHFVSFVATILSFFVCKPRVSTCLYPRARKEVLVNVRSADILTLIEGSLQIARNVVIILEEQTSRPPRNQSVTVQAPFFFVGSSHFSRKTSTNDDRCFVIKEGDSVFCSQERCANSSCKHADLFSDAVPASFRRSICLPPKLRATMETAPHCLLY